ncbi:MAG: hypothetical protein ACXVDE_08745, partial [Tumebacillaceae bacterium]
TELIRIVYGFDIVKYLLQVAIGEEPTLQLADLKPTGAAAIFFVVSDQTGVVQEVRGKEQLLALPSVVDVQLKQGPAQVNGVTSSYDRLGHVILKGNSTEEVQNSVQEAMSKIELVWEGK